MLGRYNHVRIFRPHPLKTTPIFIAGGTVAMGIVTINAVMVIIWCVLIEVQDSKSMVGGEG